MLAELFHSISPKRNSVVLILLAVVVTMANSQSKPERQSQVQDIQLHGDWTDPSTGLMWAGKDNGKGVSWKGAMKYCRNLRSTGYTNWRLPTLSELGAIYDRNVNAPGLAGKDNPFTYHVKGNLFLTGDEWSSQRRYDDRGRPSGYDWYFDFNDGRSDNEPSAFPYPHSFKRALCVRDSGK